TYTGPSFTQVAVGFAPGFTVADVATTPWSVAGGQSEWAVMSYLFNSNYAYDNRYLLQFSFRRDGASNFGENARYGNFYSIGGGWNIHQEEFFTPEYVQQLKLRASFGTTGLRPDELYGSYSLYSLGTGSYNGETGALISQVGNKDLTWEKASTFGVGLDAILFDRVSLTLDYYNKKTTDLLYKVALPGVTGVTGVFRNVGGVKNQGFELTASVDVLNTKDWSWSISANLGLNRNKVTELYAGNEELITSLGGSDIYGSADKIVKPGYDIDTWYTAEWAGVNSETGAPQWYTTDDNGQRVITDSYAEASSNPAMCGSSNPDFYGGFSTEVRWRDFDLSAVFAYSVGGKIYNYERMVSDSDGAYINYNQQKLKKGWTRWEKPGDHATHPVARYNNTSSSNSTSSRYLEDASYLRMRNLTVGYNIPLKIDFVSQVRVYFSGENLFVITGFSGIDPELPGNTTAGKAGVVAYSYPQTRNFMFGLNVTF
ncbi:MAG: SusC/RagA family TonB-linked outer membrane protein, partial [Tannerellaceae bacterium]|nr:SusC/RagA family TonB-linked outer membrane protein [Tannerellaceae bacterium]